MCRRQRQCQWPPLRARPDFGRHDRLAISSYLEAQSPRLPDLRVLASERPGQVIRFHGEEPSDGLTNLPMMLADHMGR